MTQNLPSKLALLFVFLVVGGCFVWWFRNRPSYLIYQVHRSRGEANQSSVVVEYKRLLRRKNLPKKDEIQLRRALAEFYLKSIEENGPVSLYYLEDYEVDHAFLSEAKKECDQLLKLDPKDATAHYFLGLILVKRKLENYALEEFHLSRTYDPKDPRPLYFLSRLYQLKGNPMLGREYALQALSINPDYDEARMALVWAYQLLGEHEKVFSEYQRLSSGYRNTPERRAAHALYLSKANYEQEATLEIDQARKEAPQSGWIKIMFGQILLDRGQIEQASGEFAQAAALMPRNIWPLVWQAQAFARRGQCRECLGIGQTLTEAVPRWPWGQYVMALCKLCQGDEMGAHGNLEEAIRLDPEFMEAIKTQAQLLLEKGQYRKLGQWLRKLLDQKVHRCYAYSMLAQSFYDQEEWGLALEAAESAIKFDTRNPWGFVVLGLVRGRNKDVEGGHRAFRQAVGLNQYDSSVKGYQAFFISRTGDLDKAEVLLKRLLEVEPRNALLFALLGQVLESAGHVTDAMDSFQNALSLKPYLLKAHLGLIQSYWQQGQKQKADIALKEALQVTMESPLLLRWKKKLGEGW